MLMGGDSDLNSSHVNANSVKENLRQTILNQEVVFRKQVHELHRLYTTQKTLMKECGWRELNGCKLGNGSTQSTVRSSSDQLRREPLATDKAYSTIFTVDSTQSVRNNSSKLQQSCLDLQLPSINCTNYVGQDLSVKGNKFDFIGISNERNHYFRSDDVYCREEVKLSLSIGGSSTKKGIAGEPLNDKISCAPSQDIIEIEESAEMVSNYDSESVVSLRCGAHITAGHMHDSQVPAQSDQNLTASLVKDPFHAFTITDSFIVGNGICEERNSSNEGLDECYGDGPCDNVFTKGKLFNSSVPPVDLDLNKIQLDESSFHSNATLSFPSSASSSGDAVTGSRDSNSYYNSNYVSAISPKFKEANGNNTCSIDLESMSELRSDLSEEHGNHGRNVDLRLNIQNGKHKDTTRPEVNCGKVNEEIDPARPCSSQSAHGDAHCSSRWTTPTACTFDCIAEDNPNITRTMLSGTDLRGSSLSPSSMIENFESSQVAETARQPDSGSSGSSEMKHQLCVEKKGESAVIDILVQKAALSLVCISLENPVSNYTVESTISGSNEIRGGEREQPECCIDSYEAMVLNLTELGADDYCVASNPFEVNEMDKKEEGGVKLRRGRRLKDFQKDILPGLASLSRREICEDINIMEGVMRSREYKRLRSKTGNAEKWFTSVRSRRSRLNYVGRRYYS